MKIAVLADIHGNVAALDAVLADLDQRKPDLVVDLGDRVSGPLWPRETMERLEGLNALAVRGNHDRQVSTLSPDAMGASDRYAFAELRSDQRKRLEELPLVLEPAPGVLAVPGRAAVPIPSGEGKAALPDARGARGAAEGEPERAQARRANRRGAGAASGRAGAAAGDPPAG